MEIGNDKHVRKHSRCKDDVNLQIPRYTWANTIHHTAAAGAVAAADQDSTIYSAVGGITKLRNGAILRCDGTESNSQNLGGKSEIDFSRKQKLQFVDLSKSHALPYRELRNNESVTPHNCVVFLIL